MGVGVVFNALKYLESSHFPSVLQSGLVVLGHATLDRHTAWSQVHTYVQQCYGLCARKTLGILQFVSDNSMKRVM